MYNEGSGKNSIAIRTHDVHTSTSHILDPDCCNACGNARVDMLE